jgi:hypothetical protein
MACRFCGGGGQWIKNCITKEHRALGWEWWPQSFRCCDPCYEARRSELLIVPSHAVVAARCDECQHWFNPREMTELRMGGKWSAYSGTCTLCLE